MFITVDTLGKRKNTLTIKRNFHFLFFTTIMGFASGLPLALSSGTLQAWLTVEGVDLRVLGWLSLVGLPYTYKFIWAPIIDRYNLPFKIAARRRGWLVLFTIFMAAILLVFSRLDFQASNVLFYVAILAFCLAFISSSFDVVFDAWRTEILPKKIMGLGAGWSVVGYRVAMITSGALALLLADLYFGFSGVYFLFAILFLFLALVASLIPEAPTKNSPKSLREAIREPFKEFFSRKNALLILITIILYKLGDAFALSLSTAFLIRGAGFSPGEVGAVAKGVGLFAALGGGLIGGWLLSKSNLFLCLVWFGIFQALSNLGFLWLSLISPTVTEMAFVIVFENLSGGMGTAAFVALLMALCNQRFTATQFALLSALSSVGRVFIGPFAGEIAYNFEWPIFFVCSFLVAAPGIILIYFIRHEIKEIF